MTAEGPIILYVDDERPNRIVFEQSFKQRFHVKAVASGAEALELLKVETVGVVVPAQRMPDMTGQELLTHVKALYPDIVRVVITAYSDLDPILRAVNDGLVKHYMLKPWDRAELEQLLAWALDAFASAHESSTMQLRLMQTERLVTVGSIGAMVAHDIQHPLASMTLNIQRLAQHADNAGALTGLVERSSQLTEQERVRLRDLSTELPAITSDLSNQVRLMDELMQSLRQFIHPEREVETRAVDPVAAVHYALSVCREPALRAKARLFYDGPPSLPKVKIGSTELTQVLINLIANAVQGLERKTPRGGTVSVHVADLGAQLRLVVADDGPGIPPDVLKKVGSPFFTTRQDGIGLGVAQCIRLAKKAGGELKIASKEGAGTSASVTLPKA
jgi:signal transduction histidine kinase